MSDDDYNRLTNNKYANQAYKPPISVQGRNIMKALSAKLNIPCENGMMVQGMALTESKQL